MLERMSHARYLTLSAAIAIAIASSWGCGHSGAPPAAAASSAARTSAPAPAETAPPPTVTAVERGRALVAAYRTAAGGPRLNALHALKAVGTIASSGAQPPMQAMFLLSFPNRFQQREAILRSGRPPDIAVIGFNGTHGWFGGAGRLVGDGSSSDPAVRARAETRAARQALVNFAAGVVPSWLEDARMVTYTAAGTVASGADRGALILEIQGPDGDAGQLLMDPVSHLPRRLIARYLPDIRRQAGEYTIAYRDFRPERGILLPHTIVRESDVAGRSTTTITSYSIDPTILPLTFDPPAPGQRARGRAR